MKVSSDIKFQIPLSISFALCSAVLSSGSGLEGELLGMGMWSLGLGAVGAALAGILLANTNLCLPKAAASSLADLEDADLLSTVEGLCAFSLSVLLCHPPAILFMVKLWHVCVKCPALCGIKGKAAV